jgi:hypothetical protein
MYRRASILASSLAVIAVAAGAFLVQSSASASATAPPWPLNHALTGTGVEVKWLAPGPASLGDTIAGRIAWATPEGRTVGTQGYTCAVVATNPDGLLCHGTIAFPNGAVQFQGMFPRQSFETVGVPFSTTVIAGSGPYAHVTGDFNCVILQPNVGRCTFVAS